MTVLEARVSGTVQGVGFRYFVQRRASALGLSGYTRNLPDGDVEVLAEGDKTLLEALLDDLRTGPSLSSVDNVEVRWSERPEPGFRGFNIKY